ncbi:MAG: ATP-binding protein, partial [Chloroflexi bacterium]|nr:ATP-binding protein [Chloroflexota bacterium]
MITTHHLALPDHSRFAPIVDRIRQETAKILKIPFEKFFTDHSVEGHSTRILQHLDGLTRGLKDPLCEDEVYILIASAYLHDISMAWDNKMDFLELRRKHPSLSGELVRRIANGEQIRGIQCDFGLPHPSSQYAIHTEFIARVVEGHGGTTCDVKYQNTVLGTSIVRVRFLADLLALADELDLHRARIDVTRLAQAKMPEADIFHWWKHWFIIGVRVEPPGTVRISYAFPEEMRHADLPDLVQTYVTLRLKSEYAKVESTLAPEGVALYQPPALRSFTPLALPGQERPSARIVELFRNAVASLAPIAQPMLEPNEVSGNIELATHYFMEGMLPAVVGDKLYVRRRESEEAFEEFVEHATEPLFLLAGRPGTGKTMFVRRMISKYPSFSLLYKYRNALHTTGDLPRQVVEQYASLISGKLQAKKYRDLDIHKLEEVAKSKGKWVIIFVESDLSLNDLAQRDSLLFQLLPAIRGRNIKVCLSCVADIGENLHVDADAATMIYRPSSRIGVVAPSSVLEDYSEEEFAHACIRYFDERKIKASEADFVDEARDRLKNPLWLDIYSMARADYQRKTGIETSIRYVEVCESFLTNRSLKTATILNEAEGEPWVQGCLKKMAEEMLFPLPRRMLDRTTVKQGVVGLSGVTGDRAEAILEAMKMAGLIRETYYTEEPEPSVRFAFDEIREYLMAKLVATETLHWGPEATNEAIRAGVSKA